MDTTPRLVPVHPIPGITVIDLTKPETTIGRSRTSDVYLEDPSVSRLHAWLRFRDGGYFIEDNQSRHGVKVNGKAVTSQQLADRDVINLGIYSFEFIVDRTMDSQITPAPSDLDRMQLLLEVTRSINSSLALREVLERVIDAVIQLTGAERGFVMTIPPSGELTFRAGRNCDRTDLQPDRSTVSLSIIERVRKSGSPLVLADIREASASMHSPSVFELGLRSVMCAPLKNRDQLTGLIYVDSHFRAKQFGESDLSLFQSLANQAVLAIEKSELYEQLQRYNESLEEQVRERTQELVNAQAEVMQAEKLAAIGRLAAGIAHEINSPLGVLTANVNMLEELARRRGADQDVLLDDIAQTSVAASARLRQVIKAFESFTGLDEAQWKPLNINVAIDESLTLLHHEISNRIRVSKNFGNLQLVPCNPGRIHQALMHLLTNAVQSIDGDGFVEIKTEQSGDAVKIVIRDSGRGMTSEQLARAFEPVFATKGDRVKAGLGLVATGRVIRDHGGEIRLDSTPGSGTTATVILPIK